MFYKPVTIQLIGPLCLSSYATAQTQLLAYHASTNMALAAKANPAFVVA